MSYDDVIAELEARKVELTAAYDAEVAKIDAAIVALRGLEAPAAGPTAPVIARDVTPAAKPLRLTAATLAGPASPQTEKMNTPPAAQPAARPGRRLIDREQVRKLHAEGLSDRTIAGQLGVTGVGVLGVRRELGLPAVTARPPAVTTAIPAAQLPDIVEISSAQTLIDFLRGRDADVKDLGKGRYLVGRAELDANGLLERANRERALMKKPPFRFRGQG